MITERHWRFQQESPTSTWQINNIPADAEGAYITHVKTNEGRTLKEFGHVDAPYGIELSFGIDSFAGVAYGTYYIEEEEEVQPTQPSHTTVNVTQNNGNASQPMSYYFTNKEEVIVADSEIKFGFVEVVRDGKYVPMIIIPEHVEGGLKFSFDQPESGRIF